MDIERIQSAALDLAYDAPMEAAAAVLVKLNAIKERVREAEGKIKARLLAWCQYQPGREIVIGTKRYFAGHDTDTKCTDPARALEAAFIAANGDFAKAAEYLGSDPFKYGSLRKVMEPGVYAKCFKRVTKDKLKDGDVKEQKLICVDEAFTR